MRYTVLTAALLAATASPALAQTAGDLDQAAAARDDTVVVTANRQARPLDEIGQSVTVIDAAEIRTRQVQVVSDLLRTVPGVTVTRNGPVGSFAGVNIRGAETDQNVVLIDGVKLNDPSQTGGGFNFGNLLVGNIERIEVVRGSQSVIWGSQAIGGVVNLITAAPTEELAVTGRTEYGWRDTAQGVANVSGRFGPVSASLGGNYYRTDGFSAFDGGAERDGYENVGANARVAVALSDALSIDLRGFWSDGDVDQDGFAPPSFAFGDTPETASTEELIGYAGVNLSLLDGRLRQRLAFAYTRTDRLGRDPGGTPEVTFDAVGENERFEYQGTLDLAAFDAVFGAETERSSFAAASFGGPRAGDDARLNSLYLQGTATPLAGLSITGGVRYDHHDRFGSATTLAASGVWSPNGGRTLVRASYGEGFKAPSLYQLYSDYGNTALRPERSRSWDAGITQRLIGDTAEVSATYFHRTTRNQIDFAFCPPAATTAPCIDRPFGVYDNIRRTRAQGVEASLLLRPVDRLSVSAQYSYVEAENRDTGRQLARRPRQSVSTVVDYVFPFGLAVGGTLSHVGDSVDNAAGTVRLDGYVLADLRASFPLTDRIALYGRVENLYDEQYQTIAGYGTAGRAAYAGVRLAM